MVKIPFILIFSASLMSVVSMIHRRSSMAQSAAQIKRIAICTGGGDAPGLNAVIRSATLAALNHGWEVYGIRDGYTGLLMPTQYLDGGLVRLTRDRVRGITHLGGTIIGTTNRGNPLAYPVQRLDGTREEVDRSDELIRAFELFHLDALISVGGDGSMEIANALAQKGLWVVGVPKTIDNDLDGTVITFGFNTAVDFATECLDRLHTTAASHRRVMVVEVMGRYAGWIALEAGVSGTADAILIPEIPFDLNQVAEKIRQRDREGSNFSIVMVAEGARPKGGTYSVIGKEIGQAERLGGIGEKVVAGLQELTGKETRLVVLGHLLRGGSPTAYDRLIAQRFGAAAVRALADGQRSVMVALDPPNVRNIPLEEATHRMKTVPLDSDTMLTAREMGISFGD
jgi:ATP-dependent phosphofructokinase / diphosphate-dependent phosphofructokinase